MVVIVAFISSRQRNLRRLRSGLPIIFMVRLIGKCQKLPPIPWLGRERGLLLQGWVGGYGKSFV